MPTAATDVQIRPARTAAAAAAGAARSSRCRCRRPPLPSSGRPRRRQPSLPACIPRQSRRRRPRPRPFHVRKQTTRLFFSKLYRSPTPSFPHRNCTSPGAAARRGAARAFNLHCISRSCFFILESPPARARPPARPRAGWLLSPFCICSKSLSGSAPFRLPTTAERVASGPLCRRRRRRCRHRFRPSRKPLDEFIRQKQTRTMYITELGYEVGPRLRDLAPRGQREPGGGIHAT